VRRLAASHYARLLGNRYVAYKIQTVPSQGSAPGCPAEPRRLRSPSGSARTGSRPKIVEVALSEIRLAMPESISLHGESDLFVMKAHEKGATQLFETPENETAATWAPDGGRIAFERFVLDDEGAVSCRWLPGKQPPPVWSLAASEVPPPQSPLEPAPAKLRSGRCLSTLVVSSSHPYYPSLGGAEGRVKTLVPLCNERSIFREV
jgi:hypothetical protein